jgi:hypothetical protein
MKLNTKNTSVRLSAEKRVPDLLGRMTLAKQVQKLVKVQGDCEPSDL